MSMSIAIPPSLGQRLITVEGCDRFGKSTLARALARRLINTAHHVELTAEPGGTPLADGARQLFSLHSPHESWCPESELFLVSAARTQHLLHRIIPALKAGSWVICDRFTDSTRVYQGFVGGCDEELVEQVIALSTGGLTPGLTLLLDADPTELVESRKPNSSPQATHYHDRRREVMKKTPERSQAIIRFDQQPLSFHQKIRAGYLYYLPQFASRMTRLDATLSTEALEQYAWNKLQQYIRDLKVPPPHAKS